MSSIGATLRSPRVQRTLPWFAAVLLLAGVIAFLIAYLGNTGTSKETPLTNKPAETYKGGQKVPLAKETRRVAGVFINTAVARKNLGKSWVLAAHTLKEGMTKAEWLTGTIPVVPFLDIGQARFKVDYSFKNYALLEVALLPKSSKTKGQVFFIELKKFPMGNDRVPLTEAKADQDGQWLVTSWAPRGYFAKPARLND